MQTHWTLHLQYAAKARNAEKTAERAYYTAQSEAYRTTALRLLSEGHAEAIKHYPNAR